MKIIEYLCPAKPKVRMIASAIKQGIRRKNECPIEGHPFLPNNKPGILLVHLYGGVNNIRTENTKASRLSVVLSEKRLFI